jgi:hypothetical protein
MASPVIVNGDTSLVLVNTKDLTAGQTAVVLLSSVTYPGRSVTIRDSIGYLSSPQTILISTQLGVKFADGTSELRITQPYGYLTVTTRDPYSWNVKNSFGFPQNQTIANTLSLTTSSVVTSNLYSQLFISTPHVTTNTLNATSTVTIYGPTLISTLLVGNPQTTSNLLAVDPGYSLYSQGSVKVFGNTDIEGSGRFSGSLSTGSNLFVLGTISSLGNFGARGDIMTLGNFIAANGGIIANSLDVRGTTTLGGPVTCSNSLTINSNLFVQNSISSVFYTTSSLQLFSSLSFREKYITYRGADLLFSDTVTIPGISTLNLTASNGIQTSNLTVYTSITAPQVSDFLLSSTAITNPNGSFTVSSLAANTATFSNVVSTLNLNTSSLQASTLFVSGDINAPQGGYMNINTVVTSTLSTGVCYADSFRALQFTTNALSIGDLNVTSSFTANNVSVFQAQNVAIDNTGGSISTGSMYLANLLATSTITNSSGLFTTTSGMLYITASNVFLDAANTSSITASTMTTSSLTATQITIGASPPVGINGPSFIADNTQYPSTNVVVSGGPGDYLTAFLVSNVKPPGIGPGDPYTVDMSFALNMNGPTIPGYYATILGFNLFPNGEANSLISLRTDNDATNITTLYGLYGPDQSYVTPPNTGGIPLPTGPNPSSFLHVTGTMYGTSAFSLQFQSRSNDNFSGIDSNASITMNNGVIRWPYFLNGTTIQNSLNDMSVRNIFYYGGLNFASDPSLKEEIEDADLSRCYDVVQSLPLRRYKFIDTYLSTFNAVDAHRLGFLATELEQVFPKSVTYTEIPALHSTFRVIDSQQIDMAHIGATQHLMKRVEALYSTVEGLKADSSEGKKSCLPVAQ